MGVTKTFSGLTQNTTYYIRVRAENSGGNSPWRTLTTSTLAETVELPGAPGTPVSTALSHNSINFEWTAPTTGGAPVNYYVEIAEDSGFTNLRVAGGVTGLATSGSLEPSIHYYVRVRAQNSAGNGPWSGVLEVTTPAEPVVPNPPGSPGPISVVHEVCYFS